MVDLIRLALSLMVISVSISFSTNVFSSPEDYAFESGYWTKNRTNESAPYIAVGSSSHKGVTIGLVIGDAECTLPEIRIFEFSNEDFAQVSTNHDEPIEGAKFRIDRGEIWNYDEGAPGGRGSYTYKSGTFIFVSSHAIANRDFFKEFVAGNTLYYKDSSLTETYHFSLNGSQSALSWLVKECLIFRDVKVDQEEDIWDSGSEVNRPGYDGPEWQS